MRFGAVVVERFLHQGLVVEFGPPTKYGYAPTPGRVQPIDDRVDPATWRGKRAQERCRPLTKLGRQCLEARLEFVTHDALPIETRKA